MDSFLAGRQDLLVGLFFSGYQNSTLISQCGGSEQGYSDLGEIALLQVK